MKRRRAGHRKNTPNPRRMWNSWRKMMKPVRCGFGVTVPTNAVQRLHWELRGRHRLPLRRGMGIGFLHNNCAEAPKWFMALRQQEQTERKKLWFLEDTHRTSPLGIQRLQDHSLLTCRGTKRPKDGRPKTIPTRRVRVMWNSWRQVMTPERCGFGLAVSINAVQRLHWEFLGHHSLRLWCRMEFAFLHNTCAEAPEWPMAQMEWRKLWILEDTHQGYSSQEPPLSRKPPLVSKSGKFDPKILLFLGFEKKIRRPSAAGKLLSFFGWKIAISKGKMIKNSFFSGAPAARQKIPPIDSDAILRHIQHFESGNPPWFHLILGGKGGGSWLEYPWSKISPGD